MQKLNRSIAYFLLLFLTACGGAEIRISGIQISIPERDAATPAPSVTPTRTPSATVPPSVTVRPSPSATASATRTPSVTPSPLPQATATQLGTFSGTTLANLNVRSGPGTSFPVIGSKPFNSTIVLSGRSPDSLWLKLANEQGWVSTQYVRLTSGNVAGLPEIDPTPTREGAPKNRISYNTNGNSVPDMPYWLDLMTSPCRTTALVMDNLNLAIQLKQLCPDTIVISRSWSGLEGGEWVNRSPQSFVDQWRREGHPEIVRHSTNEPSFGGAQSVQYFAAVEIELMKQARAAGFTVVVGNFSVGYINPVWLTSGAFDNYIRAIYTYRHYLGLHEYSMAALPFGVGQWQASWLTDRTRVQPASWPLPQAIPLRYWNGDCPPYWHIRRGDCWLLRADTIGVPRPRIILTEFAWDNLPDVKPYIESLRTQYGLSQYFFDLRGVNTYSKLWAWYWPQWSFSQAACEQLKWADRIYPPEYLGFDMFTISGALDWRQTDFSGRENPAHFELHKCLEAYANGQ